MFFAGAKLSIFILYSAQKIPQTIWKCWSLITDRNNITHKKISFVRTCKQLFEYCIHTLGINEKKLCH